MGCQSSKVAKTSAETPPAQTSHKTLLEGGADKPFETVTSVSESSPTPSTTDHGAYQHPSESTAHGHLAVGPLEPSASPVSVGTLSNGQESGRRTDGHGASQDVQTVSQACSQGLLRKHRTLCSSKKDLDMTLVQFSTHDSTVGSVLGRNCKEMRWKVMYDPDADPIDINLHVQEHKLHSTEVEILCNGQHIFHGAGAHAKAKLTEDFRYQWPIQGAIHGINERGFFEVRPPHLSALSGETWSPATVTCQREDGFFEVTAEECGPGGIVTKVMYPAVHKDNLREFSSKNPLTVSENCLMLEVPKQDPLHAVLSLANGELLTHHLGRPSPPRTAPQKGSEIVVKVSKDRNTLTANAGHQVISHFVSGEVQAKTSEAERLRHSWTIQVGPFAEHKVEVLKKHTLGKMVTLVVDGQILVESTAAEIGCEGNEWQCKFRFIGERVIDFEVYKTNAEGGVLDETGHVKDRRRYVHECQVTIPNEWDFCTACFLVDGLPFAGLPMEEQHYNEPNLTTSPLAVQHSYGITTPFLVDRYAPSNMMILASQVLVKATESKTSAGGFFARWCDCSTVVESGNATHTA